MYLRMVVYFLVVTCWLISVAGTYGQNQNNAIQRPRYGFSAVTQPAAPAQENLKTITTVTLDSSNLPIVIINTQGQTIPDAYKITARMKVINHGPGKINRATDPDAEYDGYIGIEVRGRFSATFPQKPYALETRDSLGNNLNISLLGMPEENDWILISNYNEKSLVRSTLSFDLFRKMGHYAPRARLCEVILNSQYRGIYVFSEKIKPDKNRVDIVKLKPEDSTGNALTGGYIISVDYYGSNDNWISSYPPFYYPNRRVHYNYVYPKPDEIIPAQKKYIQNFIKAAEGSVYGANFADPSLGYHRYVDVPSFIDYFIISEVSRNVDGYKKSRFFFKDRNDKDSLLYAGPVWDFDWAWKNITEGIFGNTDGSGWSYKTNDYNPSYAVPDWHIRLLQDSQFTNRLIERYQTLRSNLLDLNTINHYIDSVRASVDEAQKRHFALWPISGPNPAHEVEPPSKSYAEEIARLKEWIRKRLVWLDENIPRLSESIIPEIKFGDNVALKKPATASSEEFGSGNTAAKGNDGDPATRWCANDGKLNYWWKVDLNSLYDLAGSEVMWEFDGKTYGYVIDVSSDNVHWRVVVDKRNNTSTAQTQQDVFTASSARYVRITITQLTPGCWASFWEFKVFVPRASSVDQWEPVPREVRLFQNFPNPLNLETVIRYQVQEISRVQLEIYNITGQKIKTLVEGHHSTGIFSVLWSAQDESGKPVPGGIYFCRLRMDNRKGTVHYSRKMILLK